MNNFKFIYSLQSEATSQSFVAVCCGGFQESTADLQHLQINWLMGLFVPMCSNNSNKFQNVPQVRTVYDAEQIL